MAKTSESYERQNRPIQTNSDNTDATRTIQTQFGRYDSANNDDVICFFSYPYKHGERVLIDNSKRKLIKLSLIKLFRISPVTGPRSAVLAHGLRHRANTADIGPVTGPIRNYLINDIILQFLFSAHCMLMLYIPTNFNENIFHGI